MQNGEVPSLIVPILLYHGTQRWEYHTVDDLFEDVEDELKNYLPNFEYIFHDLGELEDHELEMLHNKFLAASFLASKYAFNKERLEQKAIRILLLSQSGTKRLRKSLIIYLFSRSEFDEEILDSLPANLKHDVMNTLDIYVEKGIKIGLEKGEKIGLEKGRKKAEESEKKFQTMIENLIRNTDWVDDQIADVTGISIELIREIRTSMKE